MSAAWPFICPSCGSEFRYLNNALQHAADIAALGFSRNSREHGVVKNLERAAFDNPAHGERKWGIINWAEGSPSYNALAPLRAFCARESQ